MIDDGPDRAAGLTVVAERYGVGPDAVRHLLRALEVGHGTMAQFDHPDLGGFGQWSQGGMTMIGRMFDNDLKARVAGLCAELAGSLPAGGWSDQPGAWWPPGLGRPSTSGAQNAMRYAYFPESRRLAVESDGVLALYDTGTHDIAGVSQQQGDARTLHFTGRHGRVDLDDLERVDVPAPPVPATPVPATPVSAGAPPPPVAVEAAAPVAATPHAAGGDPLTILERLAELHGKGVLSEAEFSAKKAELLARL